MTILEQTKQKDQVVEIQKILNKYESNELEIIRKQYQECYDSYLRLYCHSKKQPLRYLIYVSGYESIFNDIFQEQRTDPNLKVLSQDTTKMLFYPGNPYLYVANTTGCNGYPDINNIMLVSEFRLESLLDICIDMDKFARGQFENPAFGIYGEGYRSLSSIGCKEILYIILKAWKLENRINKNQKENSYSENEDSEEEEDSD
jgi:hypothetical protein